MRECTVLLVLLLFIITAVTPNWSKNYTVHFALSVVHFNDFHARFDEVSPTSGICKPDKEECHGGIARMATVIKELMLPRKNSILLNAGDAYQGSAYYTLFKWNITQHFLNLLPITAHTLGNHEFDGKIEGLVPLLKSLITPVVVCNIDDTLHPELKGLIKKSIVVNVAGKKIGIVGVMLRTTYEISSTENLIFLEEIDSVNKEANRLVERERVFTVIVLSHCGYAVDKKIAEAATKRVGLIVGGHSHTLLYNGIPPDNSTTSGRYPTIVQRKLDGKSVLVVQASAYTRYLGDIIIGYDEDGEVIAYKGKPVYLGPNVAKEPLILEALKPYTEAVNAIGNEILGETKVLLDSTTCRPSECNFGDFITDAMVFCHKDKAEPGCKNFVSLAIINTGGIRASLEVGNITYNDLITASPFENTFDTGLLEGHILEEVFERSARSFEFTRFMSSVNLLQVSGFKIVYDLSKPEGSRLISIQVKNECTDEFEDLKPFKKYRLAMNSFLARGGDGYEMIPDNMKKHKVGELDTDCLKKYIKHESPIEIQTDGRLSFVNGTPLVQAKQ